MSKQETNQNQSNEHDHHLTVDDERSSKRSSTDDEKEDSGRCSAQDEEVASIQNGICSQPEEYGTPIFELKRDNATHKRKGSDNL